MAPAYEQLGEAFQFAKGKLNIAEVDGDGMDPKAPC